MDSITMPELSELRALSSELRSVASRAMRSASDTANRDILRLLAVVERSPVLMEVIDRAPRPATDPLEEIKSAANMGGHVDLPVDELEEIGFIHAALQSLAADEEPLWRRAFGYGGQRGIRETTEELLHDLIQPYVSCLNRTIERRLYEFDSRAAGAVTVQVSGGMSQVNIAHGAARVVARQESRATLSESLEAVEELLRIVSETPNLEPIAEVGEAVKDELRREKPRKQILKLFVDQLTVLSGAVTAAENVGEAMQRVVEAVGRLLT